MDKYQMLDEIIVALDRLADARGMERCVMLVDLVNRMGALKNGLKDEDGAHAARIELLKTQIRDLTAPPEPKDGELREGGQTYTLKLMDDKE